VVIILVMKQPCKKWLCAAHDKMNLNTYTYEGKTYEIRKDIRIRKTYKAVIRTALGAGFSPGPGHV
jgi:hypothetical protein